MNNTFYLLMRVELSDADINFIDSEDEIPYYVHDNLVEIISSRDTKIDQLSIGESFATIKEIV